MWKCSTLVDARRCKYSRGGVKLTDRSEFPLSNFAPVKKLAEMMGDAHLYDYHDDYRRTKERNVHFFYLLTLIITVYIKLFMQRSIIPLVWQGGRSPEPWSLSTPQPFFIVVKIIFIYNYNLIIIMIGTSSEWIRNLNISFVWISRSWYLDKGRVPLPNRVIFWKN